MKKILFFLVLVSIISCTTMDSIYHVAEAGHYITYGGPYPYRNRPLVHSIFSINGYLYFHRNCPMTNGHSYYTLPSAHSQYIGNDGYYYCYENCNAVGTHMRTALVVKPQHRNVNVYREARDPSYYQGYYRADYEYRSALHNQAPVMRHHQPRRKKIRGFW